MEGKEKRFLLQKNLEERREMFEVQYCYVFSRSLKVRSSASGRKEP